MNFKSSIRRTLLCTLATALFSALPAVGQTFPNKPIRMIVPFAPGGATDAVARMFAEKMKEYLGQPIVVENKGGASTIIGTDFVAKAPADGYTLWFGPSNSFITNQFVFKKLPYDPNHDLKLIYKVTSVPAVLVVNPALKVKNAHELLEYLKNHKGVVNYGSYGMGSYPDLAGSYMSQTQNAGMISVVYKGEAPELMDLLSNNIQMTYASFMGVKQYVELGKLNAIGVTGDHRAKVMPNVPTLKEQGLDEDAYRLVGWLGFALPAATPDAIADRIYEAIHKTANRPEIEKQIAVLGYDIIKDSTPKAFKADYEHDLPIWKSLAKESGVKPQ